MARDSISSPGRDESRGGPENHAFASCHPETHSMTSRASSQASRQDNSQGGAEDDRGNGFRRLPVAVIKRILFLSDPNGFASLALLNRQWRRIASSSHLYRLHLAHCHHQSPPTGNSEPSGDDDDDNDEDIDSLRRAFNREARRNLFDVFLRPRQVVVKLISSSASPSSSFPQGEAFRFKFSANGRILLGLSSSRICVLDLSVDPIVVRHELKTHRRPVAATISDDGTLLAVESSERRMSIYGLEGEKAELMQSIPLHGVPRVCEFSPEGTVLSVAYDGGIEVYAVGSTALPTDRRALRCSGVDNLVFSRDSLMLLGSSYGTRHSDLVTVSPPLYPDTGGNLTLTELRSRMWTTQILFPEVKAGYSYVTPVGSAEDSDGAAWAVGYNLDVKAFRMVEVDEPSGGDTYFVGPGADFDRDEPTPNMFPTASDDGDLLALGFQGDEVRLYGLCDAPNQQQSSQSEPAQQQQQQARRARGSCQKHIQSATMSSNSDRLRKAIDGTKYLVHGYPLTPLEGTTAIRWVRGMEGHRLVAVAPGGVNTLPQELGGDDFPIDGGRIMVFDFECAPTNGKQSEVTLEVGEVEPSPLPEDKSTLDAEVELERNRTKGNWLGSSSPPRSSANPNRLSTFPPPSLGPAPAPAPAPTHAGAIASSSSNSMQPIDRWMADSVPFFDNPYVNTSPRSQDTLHRASTAAANSSRAQTRRFQNARIAQSQQRAIRQHRQIPHESDADNWVPPPPPYTRHASTEVPDHIRNMFLPSTSDPRSGSGPQGQEPLQRPQTARPEGMAQSPMRRSMSSVEGFSSTTSPTSPVSSRRQRLSASGTDGFRRRSDNSNTTAGNNNNAASDRGPQSSRLDQLNQPGGTAAARRSINAPTVVTPDAPEVVESSSGNRRNQPRPAATPSRPAADTGTSDSNTRPRSQDDFPIAVAPAAQLSSNPTIRRRPVPNQSSSSSGAGGPPSSTTPVVDRTTPQQPPLPRPPPQQQQQQQAQQQDITSPAETSSPLSPFLPHPAARPLPPLPPEAQNQSPPTSNTNTNGNTRSSNINVQRPLPPHPQELGTPHHKPIIINAYASDTQSPALYTSPHHSRHSHHPQQQQSHNQQRQPPSQSQSQQKQKHGITRSRSRSQELPPPRRSLYVSPVDPHTVPSSTSGRGSSWMRIRTTQSDAGVVPPSSSRRRAATTALTSSAPERGSGRRGSGRAATEDWETVEAWEGGGYGARRRRRDVMKCVVM